METRTSPSWPPERNRVMLLCGLCFCAGCILAWQLRGGAWLWLLAGLSLPLGVLLRRLGLRAGLALGLCFLSLGALRSFPALQSLTPPAARYGQILGRVYGEPRLRTDGRVSFTLCDITLDGAAWPGRAYCTLHYGEEGPPELFDGASLRMSGRVYQPEGKSGAPRFDFRAWMLQNGMSYGIAVSQPPEVLNTRESAPAADWASRLRERCRLALESVMGEDARLAMAMLLGDRVGVSEQEYEAFESLGIVHVLAVSGLHVGVLGGALLWLLEKLRLRRALRLLPLAVFLAAYCAVTGFSAATLRASVMLLCLTLAQLWGRRRDCLAALGTAMLAVLLIDPLQAVSAGFVLSFSAVAALMILSGGFRRLLDRLFPTYMPSGGAGGRLSRQLRRFPSRLLDGVKGALSASMAAQLGVLLPTAYYFHSVPLYGVAVNLLAIPYVSLLVPAFGVVLLLSPIPWLGTAAGAVASALCQLLWRGLELLSRLPGASLRVASPTVLWLAGGALALLIFSRALRSVTWRRLVAAGLVLLVAGVGSYALREPDTRYVQLAVGQADAALLFAGSQTVAIDVGADGSAVLDYLMGSGRDLDALYLTHLHLDHAGGVAALLDAGIKIGRVYLPVNGEEQRLEADSLAVMDRIHQEGIPVACLGKGDEQRYPGAAVRVLWPDGEKVRRRQDANDLPLVLAVEMGGYTILCASDLTGSYERYAAIPCDVLKVAHHGSRDSSLDEFLALTHPALALISCTSGSRSLPGAETLARLESRSISLLRTDEAGDITLWVEEGRLLAAPYKARLKE